MASLNQCMFIGNVGKIETRYLTSGEPVVNFSLAVNETWKDKSGTKQEKTEWINAVAYRKLAEVIGEYVKVGASLYISGKMTTEKYKAKDGTDRYSTKIIVNEMQMLGSKSGDSTPEVVDKPAAQAAAKAGAFDNFDNIPF